ncbi:MAG: hypothetical protein GKR77_06170 [Legionellales bacterium]|nr:hypothetical protein [Legionellales bacterium]
MNLSLFEHAQIIMDAFEKVLCALQTLGRHIHTELSYYPIWVMQGEAFENNRDKVVEALTHFAPVIGLSPQETWTCPGVVAGTRKTIALVQAVDHAKDAFKEVTQSCKTISKEIPTKPVRDILANNGYGAVKLKQVYRHLHYLEYQPTRNTRLKSSVPGTDGFVL